MSGLGIIKVEPHGFCDMCGKHEELRPYGPKDENICFGCAMKNYHVAEEKMKQHVLGIKPCQH